MNTCCYIYYPQQFPIYNGNKFRWLQSLDIQKKQTIKLKHDKGRVIKLPRVTILNNVHRGKKSYEESIKKLFKV